MWNQKAIFTEMTVTPVAVRWNDFENNLPVVAFKIGFQKKKQTWLQKNVETTEYLLSKTRVSGTADLLCCAYTI